MNKRLLLCMTLAGCGSNAPTEGQETDAGSSTGDVTSSAAMPVSGSDDISSGTTEVGSLDSSSTSGSGASTSERVQHPIDILLVVDNAADMTSSSVQRELAVRLGPSLVFTEADFRFAVIDTDAPHPACPGITEEDAGRFITTSCRDRLEEYDFDDASWGV